MKILASFSNIVILAFIFFISSFSAYAQISNTVANVKVEAVVEGEECMITAELYQTVKVSRISVMYRAYGQSEFKEEEMALSGSEATAQIDADYVLTPFIEYYFLITMPNGMVENYPLGAPLQTPAARILVTPKSPKDKEVIIMSPEKQRFIAQSEFFISISLLRASNNVRKDATKLYIDNNDVTGYALFADDMILLSPDNLSQKVDNGMHSLKVEIYDFQGNIYYTKSIAFNLLADEMAEDAQSKFAYSGDLTIENRNENISDISTWYNNANLNLTGSYKNWDVMGRVYVTSEEKAYLQPYDRFTFEVRSNWLELSVGDHTPRFPTLFMNGKRVRGFSAAINLGFFNLQATYGETNRCIEGTVESLVDSTAIGYNVVNVDPLKNSGFSRARLSEFGSYKRNIIAVRPSFGSGEHFQFGLSFIHSKDDAKSIQYSSRPKENLVGGADLLIGIDEQRILFTAQGALSVSNSDIAGGSFTDEQLKKYLEGIGRSSDSSDLIDFKNLTSKFMTINQYLKPLNPDLAEKLSTPSEWFSSWTPEHLATFAGEAALTVSYFNNYLKGTYIYHGNDFESFGNSFMRTNIAGFNIMDRIRLFENRVFVSGGYEVLKDNLQRTQLSTRTFDNVSASVSFYPRADLPNFLINFNRNRSTNTLQDYDTNKVYDFSTRLLGQVSYDFKYFYSHQVALSYSQSMRDDRSPLNLDANNRSFNLSSSTIWTDVLSTNFNFTVNNSTISDLNITYDTAAKKKVYTRIDQPLNYVSLNIGGKRLLLNNKLQIVAAWSPSFGDFKRQAIDLSAQYFALKNISFQLMMRFLLNSEVKTSFGTQKYNDMIVGLSTRLNL